MTPITLPPLPEPTPFLRGDVFDADQMRDYARAAVEADRRDAREAMRMALDALNRFMDDSPRPSDALFGKQAIDALRAALGEE